ncbi:MAG: helix-turn-helix transcriptional regulator [Alphaproteobacteria bacterium]|nr:helix-turn-helix transcriptional regulator [Alphaproteobacteria bacterium]MDD9919144.1 helix-turn-helix transcriptional regulator [Alphaproteobacteria bacterium]
MKKSSHPIDIHVGKRLKQQRLLQGISQESLAKQLGITFQQIQKYENATNRISASKLYQLSQVLEVPIQYFFDNELQH